MSESHWNAGYMITGALIGTLISPILASCALCCANDLSFRASYSRGVSLAYLIWGAALIVGGIVGGGGPCNKKCTDAATVTVTDPNTGISQTTGGVASTVCTLACTIVLAVLVAFGVIFIIIALIMFRNSGRLMRQGQAKVVQQVVYVQQGYPVQQGYIVQQDTGSPVQAV
ncbi:hypothetical protein HDU79_005864 [Rhizoclosmatium sp. JEL0117]|nr:hypothetical protein HDU79_005864 [Rhizoclosmatium sp. JEL0117]